MVNNESRKGTSYWKISQICKERGFNISSFGVGEYKRGRLAVLTPAELMEVKDTIFHDVNLLYASIVKTYELLEGKIAKWEKDGKDRELLVAVSQLREYQKMALQRLGELKD